MYLGSSVPNFKLSAFHNMKINFLLLRCTDWVVRVRTESNEKINVEICGCNRLSFAHSGSYIASYA